MESPVLLHHEDARPGLRSPKVRTILLTSITKVLECLGTGRRESVYQCALKHELVGQLGKGVMLEYPIALQYEGERVGVSYLDILVSQSFFIEVKATAKIGGKDVLQTRAYARDSGLLGALVNFKQTEKGGYEIVIVDGFKTIIF